MLQLFLCTYRVVNIVNKSLFSMKRTSVSWEITCKWQSHCFLSNKFGRQALHQNRVTDEKTELRKTVRLSFFPNSQLQFASLSFTFVPPVGTSSLDLPTSRGQIFSRARSASGRFFMFSAAKANQRAKPRAEANYRNRKWEAKDFEKVYLLFYLLCFLYLL